MTTISTARTWACLGDSITFGAQSRGNIPYPQRLDTALFPTRAAANHGVLSDTLAQMNTRYVNHVRGKGFAGLVLVGGVNNILLDETGTAAFATWNAIVTDALAQGLPVIGCTITPFKSYPGWSPARQIETDVLNAAIRGRTPHALFRVAELNAPFGDTDPLVLKVSFQGLDLDGLHWGDGGCEAAAEIISPPIQTLTP